MDISELTYAGRQVGTDGSDEDRRYRFRLGGQQIDAVLPAASAQVWRQAHPGASDDELDAWAAEEGERCVRARLAESPLDVSDVAIDHDVGGGDREDRPRYGEGEHQHR